MKRLLEQQSPADPAEAHLIELVGQAPPTSPDPWEQRRVRVRLEAARHRRPRRWRGLAPWLVGAGLLGSGTALAAWGAKWLDVPFLARSESASEPTPFESAAGATKVRTTGAPEAPTRDGSATNNAGADSARADSAGTDSAAPDSAAPGPTNHAQATPASPQAAAASRQATRRNDVSSSAAPKPPSASAPADAGPAEAASAEDPGPVVAAIRAWRSERDAPRARALLTNYLRQHPRGALAEDALALLIEITAAQKDPAALTHAQRYLRAYPRGRFRSVAERVVAASEGASR